MSVSSFFPSLFRVRFLWFCSLILLVSCSDSRNPTEQDAFGLPKLTLKIGGQSVQVEVVDTPETMARGLMFRDSLPEDAGMLFVYPRPHQAAFYMKNTRIPLSIAYALADGTIDEIHDMKPFDETSIPSRSQAIVFALEMNQGWFAKHGIAPGTRIEGLPPKK